MRHDLFTCPGCTRHVRRSAATCPFCCADVREAARLAPVRRRPTERLGRAATMAFGAAALSAAGCSTSHSPDGGADAPRAFDAAEMADAVAVYGAPDAPLPDAPPPDAGTDAPPGADAGDVGASEPDAAMDAGDIAIYGGPPPPGE